MTSLKSRMCFAAVGAALMMTSPVGNVAIAQEIRWDMPNEYGENTVTGQADKVFSGMLAENSDGRIEITHHFGGSLGFRSIDHWSAVEDGAVPLASTYVGVFTGLDPIFLLSSMPFLATNPLEAKTLIDAAREEYSRAFAESGQLLLTTEPWVPVGIWATEPILTVEDIQSLQIRTYDKNGTEVMETVGASPIQMTWSDVVPALATGMITSVLTGASPGLATNFQDYMKHYHEIGFVMTSSMIHMNRDEFDRMPEDLQQILLDTAAAAEEQAWRNVVESLKRDVVNLEAADVTYHSEVSPELITMLQEASAPMLETWKATMPEGVADAVLARYQELLAERQ